MQRDALFLEHGRGLLVDGVVRDTRWSCAWVRGRLFGGVKPQTCAGDDARTSSVEISCPQLCITGKTTTVKIQLFVLQ